MILIVEDNADLRELLQEILQSVGYQVASASNGAEGLEVARAVHPDLILLDYYMPVCNGEEFRALQKQDPVLANVPVVLLSGASETTHRVDVDGFLKKPIEADALFQVAERYCG